MPRTLVPAGLGFRQGQAGHHAVAIVAVRAALRACDVATVGIGVDLCRTGAAGLIAHRQGYAELGGHHGGSTRRTL